MTNKFMRFFVAELLVIGWVVAVFRVIESKPVAGTFAGAAFVFIGAWIFREGFRSKAVRRTPTFFAACIHLFGSALPLMLTRLANWTMAFEDVRIWGLSGPAFHRVSTTIYLLLMAATVIDGWRFRARAKAS